MNKDEKEKLKIQFDFEIQKLLIGKGIWLLLAILLAVAAGDWKDLITDPTANILYAFILAVYILLGAVAVLNLRDTKERIDNI